MWKATLVFVLLYLVLSFPLSLSMMSAGPFGHADGLENAWILSWVSHQLWLHPLALFDTHQYHPFSNTLALTEHLLMPSLLASPFLFVSNDLVLTYNLTLLVCTLGSALGMYLLVVTHTENHLAGLLSGMLFAFVPYRFLHMHHLQLQLYAFLPLALACFHRYLETDDRRWAWGYAGCIAAQCLCGSSLTAVTLFAVAAVMLAAILTTIRSIGHLVVLVAANLLALASLYPLLQPYLEVERAGLSISSARSTEITSAEPESFIASSSLLYRRLSPTGSAREEGERLFPGLTHVVLGALGWVLLIAGKSSVRRPGLFALSYGLLLLGGIVLSLGRHTPVYPWLFDVFLMGVTISDVTPFNLLALLSSSVLCGLALAWILEGPAKAKQKGVASGVAVFFIVESFTMSNHIDSYRDQPPEANLWLANSAVPGAIVELPYKTRNDPELFYARHHGFRPTLNGASSTVPASHRLLVSLFERFPSEEAILLLERLNVRYVVIHMDSYPPRRLVRLLNDLSRNTTRLMPIREFGDDLVYEVASRISTRQMDPYAGVVLSSAEPTVLEAPGFETHLQVHLATTSVVTGARIHYGPNPKHPATHIEVLSNSGEGKWQTVGITPPSWPGVSQLVLALIENPFDGTQIMSFNPVEAQELQIRLRGRESPPEIDALEILGLSTSIHN